MKDHQSILDLQLSINSFWRRRPKKSSPPEQWESSWDPGFLLPKTTNKVSTRFFFLYFKQKNTNKLVLTASYYFVSFFDLSGFAFQFEMALEGLFLFLLYHWFRIYNSFGSNFGRIWKLLLQWFIYFIRLNLFLVIILEFIRLFWDVKKSYGRLWRDLEHNEKSHNLMSTFVMFRNIVETHRIYII